MPGSPQVVPSFVRDGLIAPGNGLKRLRKKLGDLVSTSATLDASADERYKLIAGGLFRTQVGFLSNKLLTQSEQEAKEVAATEHGEEPLVYPVSG